MLIGDCIVPCWQVPPHVDGPDAPPAQHLRVGNTAHAPVGLLVILHAQVWQIHHCSSNSMRN